MLVPLLLLIVWIGVYPTPFTAMTEPSVQALIAQVRAEASRRRAAADGVARASGDDPAVTAGLPTLDLAGRSTVLVLASS